MPRNRPAAMELPKKSSCDRQGAVLPADGNTDAAESPTRERKLADLLTGGVAPNSLLMIRVHTGQGLDVAVEDFQRSMHAAGDAINRGQLDAAEQILCAQASSLNALFTDLAARAVESLKDNLPKSELLMRLALKAQSQSRATYEALAGLKRPRVLVADQANFSGGGPLQIVNGKGD